MLSLRKTTPGASTIRFGVLSRTIHHRTRCVLFLFTLPSLGIEYFGTQLSFKGNGFKILPWARERPSFLFSFNCLISKSSCPLSCNCFTLLACVSAWQLCVIWENFVSSLAGGVNVDLGHYSGFLKDLYVFVFLNNGFRFVLFVYCNRLWSCWRNWYMMERWKYSYRRTSPSRWYMLRCFQIEVSPSTIYSINYLVVF